METYPMSQKQGDFIRRLVNEGRDVWTLPSPLNERAFDVLGGGKFVSSREASAIIDTLLKLPATKSVTGDELPTEPGMYRNPADGEIYKVQKAKQSDNLYAKHLTKIGGQRLNDLDEKVHFEFEYEAGLIRRIRKSWRMTLDEARAFGIQYGVCCVCGAFLKDADSVANGIGPVCAKNV